MLDKKVRGWNLAGKNLVSKREPPFQCGVAGYN